VLSGFGNYFVLLMIGARDMAFPRLNAFGYWVLLASGFFLYSSFLVGRAPNDGWFNYVPLSGEAFTPAINIDYYAVGLIFLGISSTGGAINFIVTILKLRAPGMIVNRIPIFVWGELAMALQIVFALPALTLVSVLLLLDRKFDFHFFDADAGGDPLLWQHLFWVFGHPEVYIVALPFFGVVTDILPVFSRRPVFGYRTLIFATLAIGGLSVGVWAHHMFATGVVLLPFFSALSLLIAVPTGVKFFNWIGTMWRGQLRFATPMLFAVGFLVIFLLGGLTGVLQAMAPVDFNVTDTYFVVAHMHYVVFAAAGFAGFGAIYYWFPKFTGRMMDERLGKAHFWLLFIGFNMTFLVQHQLGLEGMPRRVVTYRESDGFGALNLISTIGSFIIAVSVLFFAWNLWRSLRHGPPAGNDPWDGQTLEWATTSPPPERNFDSLPPIRSERPFFDQKYGDLIDASRKT